MNDRATRRALNRATVARKALEASRTDVGPIHIRRLEDSIALVQAVADGLSRELGDPPSAAKRRSANAVM